MPIFFAVFVNEQIQLSKSAS